MTVFIFFYKQTLSILLINKYNESLLLVFHYCENLWFFHYKILFDNVANFFPNFIIYQKRHTFNFIKISSICTHFWKEYAQRSNLFSIITANKIFKILFTKRDLIRYYCFTNIYIVYRNRTSILVKFIFFNFSIIKLFYSFLFMVLKFSHNFLNL